MVVPFEIDTEKNLIKVVLSGELTGSDLVETLKAVYAHPSWRSGLNALWDGSKVRNLTIAKDDLPKLVAIQMAQREVVGPGRDAIVVQRIHHRVLAEMYTMMLGKSVRVTRVCDTPEEAEEFLAGA